jgi:hypothetical protein
MAAWRVLTLALIAEAAVIFLPIDRLQYLSQILSRTLGSKRIDWIDQ